MTTAALDRVYRRWLDRHPALAKASARARARTSRRRFLHRSVRLGVALAGAAFICHLASGHGGQGFQATAVSVVVLTLLAVALASRIDHHFPAEER
jgi:ferric-dicitrate binding protein FerR (iron transport regulator)